MKTLYLQCNMGAAGDMLTAALADLLPDPAAFAARFNALGIPKVELKLEKKSTCGIEGLHSHIFVDGVEEDEHLHEHDHHHDYHDHHHDHDHHHHTSFRDIEALVLSFPLSEKVKADILAVYRLIAEAESHVHGRPVEQIHFHEVGTLDAVADVAAVCMLIDELSPELILASPVHVGSGTVRCAHGILPVPAPATAYILKDVPIYGGSVEGELCTPTGAALLKHFASAFGEMPVMRTKAVGYGLGKKEFAQANCVRAFIGSTESAAAGGRKEAGHRKEAYSIAEGASQSADAEQPGPAYDHADGECAGEMTEDGILELSCNLDDMTGEELGFACERLLEAGALDVWTMPIQMKKGRPGILLGVLCRSEEKDRLVRAIFFHTTSIGIRETPVHRYLLKRRIGEKETPFGKVRVKYAEGYGVKRAKPEFEDLKRIALEKELSLLELLSSEPPHHMRD